MSKIRIGVVGYGNLGKGTEYAIKQTEDTELAAVFTRRDPSTLKILTEGVPVYSVNEILDHKDEIDVLILCGGSATDLPKQTPELAKFFNTVDSFDTHAKIPQHFANVDAAAKEGGNVALISVGWDPGMFSLARLYGSCVLPDGKDYTFWGRGVSQGHSDAIRRIEGVLDARQYTVPVESAVESARSGQNPELTTRQKHTRECYVVAEEGADKARIEQEIKTMPNYFADYDTTVNFISRRLCYPQRSHRKEQRDQPDHRVQTEARLQPRVHLQHSCSIRQSCLQAQQGGRYRLQDRIRHRSRVSLAQER